MVGARRVSAHSQPPNNLPRFVVQGKASAKNNHSSNWLSHQRVIGLAEFLRITSKGDSWIGATHDAVERIAGLSSRIYVSGGKRKIVSAKGICRIRFFRRDETAAGPFRTSVRTGEHHGANYAIAIHDGAPLLIAEAAVRPLAFFNRAG